MKSMGENTTNPKSDKAAKPADTAVKSDAPKSSTADLIKLRYLGTSGVFVDERTNTVWEKDGESHAVSADDAERLESLPYELWERVTSEAKN